MENLNLKNPMAEGHTAKIYLDNNRIIKVFKEGFYFDTAINEGKKQEFAYLSGIPVPKIYDVASIKERQVIIMEYIKGTTLGELVSQNSEELEEYITDSINIQKAIHEVVADSIEPMYDKLYNQIKKALYIQEEKKIKILNRLKNLPFDNKLCHGDFHLFNLIQSDKKTFIIDWVDASCGNVCADIYRTYLLYLLVNKDLAEMYLSLYLKNSNISHEDIISWAPIIAAGKLSEEVSLEEKEILLRIIDENL